MRFRYSSGSTELQQVRLLVGFSLRRLRFSIGTHTSGLLYSDYSTLPWRYFYQTPANGCIETKFHHNKYTQHLVSLHGGHVVPSTLRSPTATVKVIIVRNSWSRCHAPHMRENLLPVRIIRRQKATPEEFAVLWGVHLD